MLKATNGRRRPSSVRSFPDHRYTAQRSWPKRDLGAALCFWLYVSASKGKLYHPSWCDLFAHSTMLIDWLLSCTRETQRNRSLWACANWVVPCIRLSKIPRWETRGELQRWPFLCGCRACDNGYSLREASLQCFRALPRLGLIYSMSVSVKGNNKVWRKQKVHRHTLPVRSMTGGKYLLEG